MRVTVLGSRGSVPVSGGSFHRFGGATSCYLVEAAGQRLYLDAGTGIVNAPPAVMEDEIIILLSHVHIDHILGLPFFRALSQKGRRIRVLTETRNGLSCEDQLRRFLAPPLWPVWLDAYPAKAGCEDLKLPFKAGSLLVEGMPSTHPNGSTILRVTGEGKSLVYATDFEHTDKSIADLVRFAKGTDLLLYDAQYTKEEYPSKRGFGHSCPAVGMQVFKECGAKHLLFVHHDPGRTDQDLEAMEKKFLESEGVTGNKVRFAREGEVIEL